MSCDVLHTDAEEEKNYTTESFDIRGKKSVCICVLCITSWWTSVEDQEGEKCLLPFSTNSSWTHVLQKVNRKAHQGFSNLKSSTSLCREI